jgi:protein-S-isoprenylcysteine O-methyltransferase Ste14
VNCTLQALGRPRTIWQRSRLVVTILAWTSGFLLLGFALDKWLAIPPLVLHWLFWSVWLWWLGDLFPNHRETDLRLYGAVAFRRGFYRDVLFGVTCSFAQMLRPALYGAVDGALLRPVSLGAQAGLALIVLGLLMIGFAMEVLGIDGAIFVQEYSQRPQLTQQGIYGYLRHPLFFGGTITSIGAAIVVGGKVPIALALSNLAILPLYMRFEDRRCARLFGHAYGQYMRKVPPFVPRWRNLVKVVSVAAAELKSKAAV